MLLRANSDSVHTRVTSYSTKLPLGGLFASRPERHGNLGAPALAKSLKVLWAGRPNARTFGARPGFEWESKRPPQQGHLPIMLRYASDCRKKSEKVKPSLFAMGELSY